MRPLIVCVVSVVCVICAVPACKSARLEPSDAGIEAPVLSELGPVGSDATLDIGAWNLKNFPCGNASSSTVCRGSAAQTPGVVAGLIRALQVDLLSVEEIDDEAAFHDVVAALPGYDGALSTHTYFDGTYQKVGFLWNTAVLDGDAASATLLFQDDGDFPRPPLSMSFIWKGPGAQLSFTAISVHLKAGGTDDDFARRAGALQTLAAAVSPADRVVVLGDFNEVITEPRGLANFQPFSDTARYDIRTLPAATSGAVSFLPSGVVIDHIVTTHALASFIGASDAVIPRIDGAVADYLDTVSDHLPVFLDLLSP